MMPDSDVLAVLEDLTWFDDMAASTPAVELSAALWTEEHLIAFLPWKRSSIYELVKTASFPCALSLPGPRGHKLVWLRHDVLRWVAGAERVRGDERCGHLVPTPGHESSKDSSTSNDEGWLVEPTRRSQS